MESRVIKGQVWIHSEVVYTDAGEKIQSDSLVQDQVLITPVGTTENVVSLIDDIWEDLLSDDGLYKTNGKGYFYWEYKMTDLHDDSSEVVINFECPKPKDGLFEAPYNPDLVDSTYAKFWLTKLKTADENAQNAYAVQKKEVTFPGSSYISPTTKEPVVIEEMTFKNNDIGDITNLISLF